MMNPTNPTRALHQPVALPQPLFPSSLRQATSFEVGLPIVRRVAPLEPELTTRIAFEALVSAACYLSLAPTDDPAATLEGVQMLHDLAEEMRCGGLDLGATPQHAEDLIWRGKQMKWEQRNLREATIGFRTSSSQAQQAGSKAGHASERRPRLTRWWSAWRGVSPVQPF